MATLSTVRSGPMRLHRIAGVAAVAAILAAALAPPVSADEGLEVTTPFPAVAVAPGNDHRWRPFRRARGDPLVPAPARHLGGLHDDATGTMA